MDENIKLSGTIQEQANQFWNILKERHLSVEEIQVIAPMTKDFIQALGNCIQRQIESEEKNYQQFHASMQAIITLCNNVLKDNVVSQQERAKLFELLDKLSERMCEVQKNKQNNDHTFKIVGIFCLTFLGTIITTLLAAGRKGSNS